jgi:hypothetical protein
MLTTLGFIYLFIYFLLLFIIILIRNYNFVLCVMHITPHLHVVKDFWNF